ncbi:NfeD family protein [Pedomonas mirosovicensis]|uniref:NfeD family protein n=1 Tax=Pedomonas mirosovicensis TaxID=2908641 RepID=UPI0021696D4D|nr:NfeD family protein [Pedomonas mirosovicensis]MCH8684782.1 NfeD family protein [Pedomonas mirosovicensis]
MTEPETLKLTVTLSLEAWWLWWTAALLLAAAEMAAPGAFLIWLGLAAGLTGVVTLIFDLVAGREMGLEAQLAVFAVLAIASVLAGRRWARRSQQADERPVSRRAGQLVGRTVVLVEPIVHGAGRAELDDTVWEVRGPDAPVGTVMRVVRTEGAALIVEPV